jgi:hypothetical protein
MDTSIHYQLIKEQNMVMEVLESCRNSTHCQMNAAQSFMNGYNINLIHHALNGIPNRLHFVLQYQVLKCGKWKEEDERESTSIASHHLTA